MAQDAKQTGGEYIKLDERLYHEQRGQDRPFNWAKLPQSLYGELFDVEICLSSTLEREHDFSSITFAKAADRAGDEAGGVKEVTDRIARQLSTEGRKPSVTRELRAKVKFESRRVNTTADFTCREGEGVGSLVHMSGSVLGYVRDHAAAYLSIETYLPAELFQPIAQQIEAGKAGDVRVGVECDVFQSEVQRSLAEPWMTQEYTIEEGSGNFCGLKWLRVGGTKYNPPPPEFNERGDEDSARPKMPPGNAGQQLQAVLIRELQKTNRSLKILPRQKNLSAASGSGSLPSA